MTDLVDQMFPPINRKTAPDYTDFNFWRAPLPTIDFPELAPPSPALSARSDQSTSRISLGRLGSLASTLSRRSSRRQLADGGANANRNVRGATPTSPLLQATVPEEPLDDEEDDDESMLGRRSRSSSMPGSLPDESDFERYRQLAGKGSATSEAEQYKKKVKAGEEDEEDNYDDEEHGDDYVEGDEFGDQLDFSSVPVRYHPSSLSSSSSELTLPSSSNSTYNPSSALTIDTFCSPSVYCCSNLADLGSSFLCI
jgi:phosphatidate phosphatase LPIN